MQLFRHFGGGFFVYAFLNVFNQGQYVAHTQNAAGDTVGVERLEAVDFLADTDKFNRFAGYVAYGQCRTAARVAVHLGQHDAGQRQGFIKCLGSVYRILTQHRIDDEQSFNRANRRMKRFDFVHHLFIDCQTTGGIDHQDIVKMFFGVIGGGSCNLNRVLVGIGREKIHTDLFGQQAQLFDRGRAVNVGRDHQNLFLLIVFQQAGEFADGRRLARALQTRHQHDGGRCNRQIQRFVFLAHQFGQGFVYHADKCLIRRQAARHFLTECLFFDVVDELFDDRQGDIRLKQGEADFAQGFFNIVFGQFGLPPDVFEDIAEAAG